MAIAVHPYISGVPHRIRYFEKIYAYMKKRPGVLFWKGEDVLDWYRSVTKATGGRRPPIREEPCHRPSIVDIHAQFVPEGYLKLIETDGAAHGLGLRPGPDGPLIMIGHVPIGPSPLATTISTGGSGTWIARAWRSTPSR